MYMRKLYLHDNFIVFSPSGESDIQLIRKVRLHRHLPKSIRGESIDFHEHRQASYNFNLPLSYFIRKRHLNVLTPFQSLELLSVSFHDSKCTKVL